jgi:hypothetical protein
VLSSKPAVLDVLFPEVRQAVAIALHHAPKAAIRAGTDDPERALPSHGSRRAR